ncbi:unnamed protein product [marine sediment metagenome]|uniref:Uncharacterized protein n=1 Tax=marine sediment metagenome TaxID=412755 RepID=X0ZKA5_9ZZZZ
MTEIVDQGVAPSQFVEQEMTLLEQRMKLKERIEHGILKLLLCNLEDLSAVFILGLQRDLEEWFK